MFSLPSVFAMKKTSGRNKIIHFCSPFVLAPPLCGIIVPVNKPYSTLLMKDEPKVIQRGATLVSVRLSWHLRRFAPPLPPSCPLLTSGPLFPVLPQFSQINGSMRSWQKLLNFFAILFA